MKNIHVNYIIIFVFAACEKDKMPAKQNTENFDLLTNHEWILSTNIVDPPIYLNGNLIYDLNDNIADCEKDNFLKFEKNYTYLNDPGFLKCDPKFDIIRYGTWVFNTDMTYITLNGIVVKIVHISNNKLVLQSDYFYENNKHKLLSTYDAK